MSRKFETFSKELNTLFIKNPTLLVKVGEIFENVSVIARDSYIMLYIDDVSYGVIEISRHHFGWTLTRIRGGQKHNLVDFLISRYAPLDSILELKIQRFLFGYM